jgi:Fe2+ transport system protein B
MTTKLLGRMDRYVLRKFFSTYVVVLLTFIAISVVFDITEKLDDFINCKLLFQLRSILRHTPNTPTPFFIRCFLHVAHDGQQ